MSPPSHLRSRDADGSTMGNHSTMTPHARPDAAVRLGSGSRVVAALASVLVCCLALAVLVSLASPAEAQSTDPTPTATTTPSPTPAPTAPDLSTPSEGDPDESSGNEDIRGGSGGDDPVEPEPCREPVMQIAASPQQGAVGDTIDVTLTLDPGTCGSGVSSLGWTLITGAEFGGRVLSTTPGGNGLIQVFAIVAESPGAAQLDARVSWETTIALPNDRTVSTVKEAIATPITVSIAAAATNDPDAADSDPDDDLTGDEGNGDDDGATAADSGDDPDSPENADDDLNPEDEDPADDQDAADGQDPEDKNLADQDTGDEDTGDQAGDEDTGDEDTGDQDPQNSGDAEGGNAVDGEDPDTTGDQDDADATPNASSEPSSTTVDGVLPGPADASDSVTIGPLDLPGDAASDVTPADNASPGAEPGDGATSDSAAAGATGADDADASGPRTVQLGQGGTGESVVSESDIAAAIESRHGQPPDNLAFARDEDGGNSQLILLIVGLASLAMVSGGVLLFREYF